MDLNQVKKDLYKQKPTAYRVGDTSIEGKVSALYRAKYSEDQVVFFKVPYSDMGTKAFEDKMEAHLLIRWISTAGEDNK